MILGVSVHRDWSCLVGTNDADDDRHSCDAGRSDCQLAEAAINRLDRTIAPRLKSWNKQQPALDNVESETDSN